VLSRALPDGILAAVAEHAWQLGRDVAADDLFLLALAGLDEAQPARRVLADAGLDADRLRAELRTAGDGPLDHPGSGLTFAPAFYVMEGRSEAFAATLGDGRATPEHLLLALIWDPTSSSSHLLSRLGVSRQQLVDGLRALGVPVPAAPLPERQEVEWGERVWFARGDVSRVLEHLGRHLPPGTRWGFNYDGDRAWAVAEASVDLDALVQAALAGS
jgi:hypothetical protein